MVNDLYFAGSSVHPTLTVVSLKHIRTIRAFAAVTVTPSSVEERKVRRAVMLAQRQVEQDMESDFAEFQRSELWFRVIGDLSLHERKNNTASPKPIGTPKSSSSPVVNKALRDATPESPSSSSFGLLFGLGSPAPSSSAINTTPSSSGYFTRPSHSKLELLMSPTSPTASNDRTPLFDDPDNVTAPDEAQVERMEAIQAALTDIMALDKDVPDERRPTPTRRELSASDSFLSPTRSPKGGKRRVLFEDERDSDDASHSNDPEETEQSVPFQLAAPGDLQLSHEIKRLTTKIESLESQDRMLDALIHKADLTGDERELKLLRQSRSAYTRELRELRFQRTQYEQQEATNRLVAERTRVAIVNVTTAEESGKSVVRYLVEVQQLALDGTFSSGWVVARRYNEFFVMHNKLKESHAMVRSLEFPGKRLVTALSGSFVDTRRVALEKYLQVWSPFDLPIVLLNHMI